MKKKKTHKEILIFIITHDGACFGIDCKDCPLTGMHEDSDAHTIDMAKDILLKLSPSSLFELLL